MLDICPMQQDGALERPLRELESAVQVRECDRGVSRVPNAHVLYDRPATPRDGDDGPDLLRARLPTGGPVELVKHVGIFRLDLWIAEDLVEGFEFAADETERVPLVVFTAALGVEGKRKLEDMSL